MSWFGAVTVAGWLLVVVTALVLRSRSFAAFVGVLVGIYSLGAAAMFQLMYFSALVIGLISLAMLPAVLKLRQTPPPSGITAFAVVVGAAPLVTRILQAVL